MEATYNNPMFNNPNFKKNPRINNRKFNNRKFNNSIGLNSQIFNENATFTVVNPLMKQPSMKQISLFSSVIRFENSKEKRESRIQDHKKDIINGQSKIINKILENNIDNILKPGKDLFEFFKKYTNIYYTKVKNVYNPRKTHTHNLLKPFLKITSSILSSKKKSVKNYLREKQDEINNDLESLINEYFNIEENILKLTDLKRTELLLELSIDISKEKNNKSQNEIGKKFKAYIINTKFDIIKKLIIKYIHKLINTPANYNKTILGKLRYLQDKYNFMHRNFIQKNINVNNLEFTNIIDSSIIIDNICIFAWNADINNNFNIDYKIFNKSDDLLTLYKNITEMSINPKDSQKFSNIMDKINNYNFKNINNLSLAILNKTNIKNFIRYIKYVSFNNPLLMSQYSNLVKNVKEALV